MSRDAMRRKDWKILTINIEKYSSDSNVVAIFKSLITGAFLHTAIY